MFGVDDIVGYRRSPSDVLRLILFGLATIALLALTRWAEGTVRAFESDVVALFGGLNPSVERALSQTLSVAAGIMGLAVYVPPLLLKRYRLIGYIVVANVATALLVGGRDVVVEPGRVPVAAGDGRRPLRCHRRSGSLNLWTLAQLTSSFVILAPFVGRRWRQAGIVILATLRARPHRPRVRAARRDLPRRRDRRDGRRRGAPRLRSSRPAPDRGRGAGAALASSALPRVALEPYTMGVRGARWYVATDADGARFLVKVLSPDERSIDLLYRTYRYLRLKNVGDERPFSSLRRSVEHEAFVALQARDVGVGDAAHARHRRRSAKTRCSSPTR